MLATEEQENLEIINTTLKDVFDFTQKNEQIKQDFYEYLLTIGANNISLNQMEKVFLPYIFERNINNQSVLEIFCTENHDTDEKIKYSLLHSNSSIFEIKKVLKTGFELYNLVNEKIYTVFSLTKMINFRGIYAGQYIVARLIPYQDKFYLVEISSVLSHSQKDDAYRYAVMKLVREPGLLYMDNLSKENEIKSVINEMYQKFVSTFHSDIILTTNKYADEIIGAFNEGETVDLSDKQANIENYRFFQIKELENNYSNFLENAAGGFSSHYENYDVAIFYDKNAGLYIIPFYETFKKIFENKDQVENYQECIKYFLENVSIPKTILNKVKAETTNFMELINDVLKTNYTYEELILEYKPEDSRSSIYSSATVLYTSKAFANMYDILPSKNNSDQPVNIQNTKVGRNTPCPCGSGKKYKHCCGKNTPLF